MRRFFVRDVEKWERRGSADKLLKEAAEAPSYDNAMILPLVRKAPDELSQDVHDAVFKGGVCDEAGAFIAGRRRSLRKHDVNLDCEGAYDVAPADVEYRDEAVVFGGILYRHFGHALIDTFSRLWYLAKHPDFSKVVFLKCPFEFESDYEPMNLVSLLGIPEEKIEIVEVPTRFRNVVVPDEAFVPHTGYMKEFVLPFDRIRERIASAEIKKLYLTRRKFEKQRDDGIKSSYMINEAYYESFFERRGFTVVAPEQLSLEEQIALISGADEIVTTIGTMTHMLLFAKPDVKATILNRVRCVMVQLLIDKAKGIEPFYVDASSNPLPVFHSRGPFLMRPNRFFKDYLDATGVEYDEEELADAGDCPVQVFEFMEEWALTYRDPFLAKTLGDKPMLDAIESMNDALFDIDLNSQSDWDGGFGDSLLDGSDARAKKLQAENARLTKRLNELEGKLQAMKSSTSWKITAPLRALGRPAK